MTAVVFLIALFGGNANNGTLDGTFYLNVNNTSSNLNVNIGTGILYVKIDYRPVLTINVKYTTSFLSAGSLYFRQYNSKAQEIQDK